ncbi:Short chain dehydrogenase virK [Paramyrothecium foliicola]|nr:Short chain dehydrogenase virK [Paramyrothecium foliicola]
MAELALAIAPLCLSAIAGINFARKKFKIFRHHDKEIKRLRKKFTAQADIFLDECQLLFQDFLDAQEAEAIIENPDHPRWSSPQLSEQIRNHLGRKYTAFKEAIEEVKTLTAALSQGLDAGTAENTHREKIREAINVVTNKSKYESLIQELKESNQEIKRLRKTASVLQFHSTPWLQPYWKLQDISYFSTDEGLAASLDTLHISSELSKRQQKQPQRQDIIMLDNPNEILTAQHACGIRNLTMHSLGVALLQIGQWSAIDLDNVVEVRKIADFTNQNSRLGPRYQSITQQCLDCDFGFGKDLSQPELQAAIYKDVVCELESLIFLSADQSLWAKWEFLRQLSADTSNVVVGIVRNKAGTDKRVSEELNARSNITIVEADITDFDALKASVAATAEVTGGTLDYLVANAGALTEYDSYDPIGVLFQDPHVFTEELTKALHGHAKKVIFITSGHADPELVREFDISTSSFYAISKAGMNMAIAKLSAQYKQDGILFLSISPGVADTGHQKNLTPHQIEAMGQLTQKFAVYAPNFRGLLLLRMLSEM